MWKAVVFLCLAVTAVSCLETGLKGSVLQGGDNLKAAVQAAQLNATWHVYTAGQAGRELRLIGSLRNAAARAVSAFVSVFTACQHHSAAPLSPNQLLTCRARSSQKLFG